MGKNEEHRSFLKVFLYSKWFFLLLAAVCIFDLVVDWGVHVWGFTYLNLLIIPLDAVAAALAIWMFTDLHRRRPKSGNHTGG